MIALVQRVLSASVEVNQTLIGEIDQGLLVYLGVEKNDNEQSAKRLSERVLGYRIFCDEQDKMNLDVTQVGGKVLVVSQFTLAADTKKGKRPSFSSAAHPDVANQLYQSFIEHIKAQDVVVEKGEFGGDMKVQSVNDGPINFILTV